MDDKILWIFLHTPRSGGTSLFKYIEKKLFPEETIRIDATKLSKKTAAEKKKIRFVTGHTTYFGIHKLIPGKIPRYITILRDPAEMLVSLYHSRMDEFQENRKQSFEKWYSLRKRNETTLLFDELFRSTNKKIVLFHIIKVKLRLILDKIDKTKTIHTFLKKLRKKQNSLSVEKEKFQNAKKLLDECWFICITEHLNDDSKFLFKGMGIKGKLKNSGVSKIPRKLFTLDKKTREKIYQENPLDVELYNYALKLNKAKKEKFS